MAQVVTKKAEITSEKSKKMTIFDTPKEIKADSRDTIKEERDRPSFEEDFELESRRAEYGIRD